MDAEEIGKNVSVILRGIILWLLFIQACRYLYQADDWFLVGKSIVTMGIAFTYAMMTPGAE